MSKYICPVCGWDKLDEKPEKQDYNICPCCFTEFGNDDCKFDERSGESLSLKDAWSILTKKWLEQGMKWHSSRIKPENWNPIEQLKNIGVEI